MNNRPKIKIVPNKIQKLLAYIAFGVLLLHYAFVLIHYDDLPKIIPTHFNAAGTPDSFGAKSSILILPIINIIIYIGLTVLSRFPHIHNYMVNITEENAVFQYTNSIQMLSVVKLIISILFAFITYSTIAIALGKLQGLGIWFLPIFITVLFSTIGYFIYKMLSKTNSKG
jgi:uncharacterized membrane protein